MAKKKWISCKNSNFDCISTVLVQWNANDCLTQTLVFLGGVELKKSPTWEDQHRSPNIFWTVLKSAFMLKRAKI